MSTHLHEESNRLLDALSELRSTRTFTDEVVTPADLDRIVNAARWTGSARNRQPWRFIAVTDRSTKQHLSSLGAYAGHLAAAPVVLVVLSEDNGMSDTEFDVGRVVQSITLAAHALELGSCVATLYPAANIAAAATLVHAPAGWQPRHAIAIGRPASTAQPATPAIPTGRLSVDRLLLRLPRNGTAVETSEKRGGDVEAFRSQPARGRPGRPEHARPGTASG